MKNLAKLHFENQDLIRRLTEGLNREAHFLPYAPATFIGFRNGAYLQLSVSTKLNEAGQSSRYKLAALAFDDHVSHLVRSVLEYFPQEADFDGNQLQQHRPRERGDTTHRRGVLLPFSHHAMFCQLRLHRPATYRFRNGRYQRRTGRPRLASCRGKKLTLSSGGLASLQCGHRADTTERLLSKLADERIYSWRGVRGRNLQLAAHRRMRFCTRTSTRMIQVGAVETHHAKWVIRVRPPAQSVTTLPRPHRLRWLARRGHRPVRGVRR